MHDIKIIGIGGTNGSGKDTVSQVLVDNGWLFISSSADLLIPELKKRGLPLEREEMAALGAEWRREFGMGVLVDKGWEVYKSAGNNYKGLVISSLRHPGEADRIHGLGGNVVWVDADPKVRYDRIHSRGQGDKDRKTYEQFLAEEKAEMTHSGDAATLNAAAVKDKADINIQNNGNDIDAFKLKVKKELGL